MGIKTKALLLILAVVFPVAINPLSALAQSAAPNQGISLQISPLPIELNAKPGSSVSADLRVRNAGAQDEKLQVRILKVSADNAGNVHLTQPPPGDELASWVHFNKTVFDAPAGEWQTINMRVDLPSSAAFGYYFAVEYLRATAEAPQPGRAVARGAVATFILLNADAPGAKRQASVASFVADRKSYEFLPVNFQIKVRSTGNVHVAPHGNIFILKGSKQVGSIQVNQALGNVLPSSARFFEAAWGDGFPVYQAKYNGDAPAVDKSGKPIKSLKWDFAHANRLRFGHYTAHLVMIYDNGQRDVPMEAYVSFWVVPWRIVGAVAGLLLLITGLITYVIILRRRLKRAGPTTKKAAHD
jgi:hypothetical protein